MRGGVLPALIIHSSTLCSQVKSPGSFQAHKCHEKFSFVENVLTNSQNALLATGEDFAANASEDELRNANLLCVCLEG